MFFIFLQKIEIKNNFLRIMFLEDSVFIIFKYIFYGNNYYQCE